jgi:pSer/pThr/pTyr-binding forkhead associated (FHA) protein
MQDSAVPIMVVQEGQLAGKRWPLSRAEFVIGRGEDCDIVLPDRQVSRHHFRVVRDDDGYNVEDLGSKNGTYVNGEKIGQRLRLETAEGPLPANPLNRHQLHDGDEVFLGRHTALRVGVHVLQEVGI